MRHVASRVKMRRGRVFAATSSAMVVGVAVLGAAGIIPAAADGGAVIATDGSTSSGNRGQNVANRSKRPDSVEGGGDPGTAPSSKPPAPRATADPDEALPAESGTGRRIVYRLATNHVWLVGGDNEVERSYLVSGTRFGQVRAGTYEVERRSRNTTSYHGTERMEYMVVFTEGENAAIGFHNIPTSLASGKPVQSLTQLGTSLSDGCVRQKQSDAKALWEFAPNGTKVVVLA